MTAESKILEFLNIDLDDPAQRLGVQLAEEDHELIRALVKMRHDKGLKQAEIAARMQRDPSAVSNFERLGGDPHMSTIRRYALAVGARIFHQIDDAELGAKERQLAEYASNVLPFEPRRKTASVTEMYEVLSGHQERRAL